MTMTEKNLARGTLCIMKETGNSPARYPKLPMLAQCQRTGQSKTYYTTDPSHEYWLADKLVSSLIPMILAYDMLFLSTSMRM